MDNTNWNIVGANKVKMKFIIPVKPLKKQWEFWKKDESKQALKGAMNKFNEAYFCDEESH